MESAGLLAMSAEIVELGELVTMLILEDLGIIIDGIFHKDNVNQVYLI